MARFSSAFGRKIFNKSLTSYSDGLENRLAESSKQKLDILHEEASYLASVTGKVPQNFEIFKKDAVKKASVPWGKLFLGLAVGAAIGIAAFMGAVEIFDLDTSRVSHSIFTVDRMQTGVRYLRDALFAVGAALGIATTMTSHAKAKHKEIVEDYSRYLDDFQRANVPQKAVFQGINYRDDHVARLQERSNSPILGRM